MKAGEHIRGELSAVKQKHIAHIGLPREQIAHILTIPPKSYSRARAQEGGKQGSGKGRPKGLNTRSIASNHRNARVEDGGLPGTGQRDAKTTACGGSLEGAIPANLPVLAKWRGAGRCGRRYNGGLRITTLSS